MMSAAGAELALLGSTDLVLDFEYAGGRSGNARDEPIHHLLGVSNQGGFRYLGRFDNLRLLVLYSSFDDADWPDSIDPTTGVLTYFGDNKEAGRELHGTPRRGNQILRDIFNFVHTVPSARQRVPPIFVFSRGSTGRNVVFRGLAVPGAAGVPATQDLVAVWKTAADRRYQNYRAVLTILNEGHIQRQWIERIRSGGDVLANAPPSWVEWRRTGAIRALRSEPTRHYRTRDEQLPTSSSDRAVLKLLCDHFARTPYDFEVCAAELVRLHLQQNLPIRFTPPSRDGGRDAIGKYLVGSGSSSIPIEFAIEAKCYSPQNAVGVKQLSRLISRIRHRQFGVLVTTSYLQLQAYQELVDDAHPIIVIAGIDIIRILRAHGYASQATLAAWLASLNTHSAARAAQLLTDL